MEYKEHICPICDKEFEKGVKVSNGQIACSKEHAERTEQLLKEFRAGNYDE